jgi:signal transduction histidine kinase
MDRRYAWQSLKVRLPAGIVLLLLAALASFAFFANREVETALLVTAESRLLSASEQIGGILAESAESQIAILDSLSAHPEIVRFLRAPLGDTRQALQRVLDSVRGRSADDLAVAVRAPNGAFVGSGDTALALIDDGRTTFESGVGRFVPWGEHVAYRLIAPVVVGGETLGHLVSAQAVEPDPEATRLIVDLIGFQAELAIGSDSGGVWTDLVTRVEAPPAAATAGAVSRAEGAGGEPIVGVLTRITGGPRMLWVALPESTILAPQRAFAVRMGTVALMLVLVGGLGGWLLGHRIVGGLVGLAGTAEAIAQGDYARRSGNRGVDEVGRLGRAFDAMADQVQESHDLLEDRVRRRTEELETAVQSLEEAQAELVRKERLALLGELAGGVGHELRNPLGVMTNAVYYLRTVLADPPEAVNDYLGILHDQIQLSEKIVRDLLDFARIRPPSPAPTDLRDLAETQLTRIGDLEDVLFEWDFPDDLPTAYVDPGQMGQVIQNLMMNAKQAVVASGGGTVTVRAREEDSHVVVEVADTGPGVPPNVAEVIFEPLFTTKARGIGLGLSVSRSLVEANGGRLWLVNGSDRGATFAVSLPVRAEAS